MKKMKQRIKKQFWLSPQDVRELKRKAKLCGITETAVIRILLHGYEPKEKPDARFYEAMACKTLIIGYKPDTFDELFPSDAMIDLENDETLNDVIRFFEEHPEEYQRIVDRNYDLIVKKHTWKERYYAIQKEFALLKNKI